MRTLSTIIIIVIILLGGSYASHQYIETMTQTAGAHLQAVEQSISAHHWEGAKKELSIVQESWDKNSTWWSILLDHQEIDSIVVRMHRLDKFIDTKDISLALGELSNLQLLFTYIEDSEKFNLRNIF